MFRKMIMEIFSDIWPMILIFSLISISLRIVYIYINKKKFIFYKEIINLCFIVYIICLFRVISFQDVSWSTSNFIPFKEMFRYNFGSKLFFKNVIGNMIMFIPYGFFISYILKIRKPILIFILSLFASTIIEFTQLQIGRVFDIDDIFLNIIGGLIGYIIYIFISKIKFKRLPNELIYNIIIVIIIIFLILYLMGVVYV